MPFSQVILTAAHCIMEDEDFPAGVVLGDHQSFQYETTEGDYEVIKFPIVFCSTIHQSSLLSSTLWQHGVE